MGKIRQPDQKDVWSQVWREYVLDEHDIRKKIDRERSTIRWKRMREYLNLHRPHSGKLRTLELGAGSGDYSLLLALEGCEVTLLDREPGAMDAATRQFKCYKQEFRYVLNTFDAGRLEILDRYDVVLSIGVIEHFVQHEQEVLFRLHVNFARPGGVVFVSVPNRFCIPYRIWKWRLERSRRWPYGLEIPQDRRSLLRWGQEMGLGNLCVIGSSFLKSWDEYLLGPLTSRLHKYLGIDFEKASWLDEYAGYALVLAGVKRFG